MDGHREWRFLLLSVVCSACLCVGATVASEPDAEVVKWAERVLLGPEFGGVGKICSRWVTSPSVSVFGGTTQNENLIAETVAHLNKTLADTSIKGLRLLKPNAVAADIRVYFVPLKEFPALAKKHGFGYVERNHGYFWTFWNSRNEIQRAHVLLATDKLRGAQLRHFALEELTQALGLSNDSPVFSDSIFYAGAGGGGNAVKLSDLDKSLLVFFYNHVQPGARSEDVREAMRRHWPTP